MKLEGRSAIVTGASRGLGLAIARALTREGAAVACMARAGQELERAVAGLAGAGAKAVATPADVTREPEVAAAIEAAARAIGDPDILVLNAGTWQGAPIHQTTEAQWDLLVDLNLKGAFLPLKHALPRMIARKRGTVVGIASIGGLVGQPGSAAYAASKWGLRGLLESAALEVKPHGIRVTILYPHQINSAGPPIAAGAPERQRKLEPDDIAALVAFACAAPAHVSIGNATVWPIDAGLRDIML
jgi:NAD(P)-dependent dehydrogenase (short-subunit alcohol dehydrogenase family)